MGYISELRKELGSRPVIMAGAGVILINENNGILLQKRSDNGYWDYPAGSMEIGESFEECARREVFEETGLVCGKLEYFTEISGKDTFYEYPNGDQVYVAAIIYLCRDYTGTLKEHDDEVITQKFIGIDELPEYIPPLKIKKDIFDKLRNYLQAERK